MATAVSRQYDNSRPEAAVRATRLRVIEAAKELFVEQGSPATHILTGKRGWTGEQYEAWIARSLRVLPRPERRRRTKRRAKKEEGCC